MVSGEPSGRCVFLCYDDIGVKCVIEACRIGMPPVGIITFPAEQSVALSGGARLGDELAPYQLEIHETTDVNGDDCLAWLTSRKPDATVIAGWPRLVHQDFVDVPQVGVFGMHPTLLPKHRGRAPIPWTIISRLTRTGVTLYQIVDASADAGPIVAQQEIPIEERETATTLYGKVSDAHIRLIGDNLSALCDDSAPRREQDESRASHWPRRRPVDGIIDWDTTAAAVDTWVRALTRPYPGAFTWLGDRKVTIWDCEPNERQWAEPPGSVVHTDDGEPVVVCGRHGVRLLEIGWETGPPLRGVAAAAALPPGCRLG